MSEKEKMKNEYITTQDLEEQTKVIIEALDSRLNTVRDELKADIKDVRDELYVVRDELKADINNVQTLIDGYVKAQEDFKQDFVIMKEEVKQMKQVFKEKLGVEIRAF